MSVLGMILGLAFLAVVIGAITGNKTLVVSGLEIILSFIVGVIGLIIFGLILIGIINKFVS